MRKGDAGRYNLLSIRKFVSPVKTHKSYEKLACSSDSPFGFALFAGLFAGERRHVRPFFVRSFPVHFFHGFFRGFVPGIFVFAFFRLVSCALPDVVPSLGSGARSAVAARIFHRRLFPVGRFRSDGLFDESRLAVS